MTNRSGGKRKENGEVLGAAERMIKSVQCSPAVLMTFPHLLLISTTRALRGCARLQPNVNGARIAPSQRNNKSTTYPKRDAARSSHALAGEGPGFKEPPHTGNLELTVSLIDQSPMVKHERRERADI
ncbi:hypothetical protein HN011_006289 [Eciton burchellii]|nr:hypothetical protein HN011_006289 [Eciton burchellii]